MDMNDLFETKLDSEDAPSEDRSQRRMLSEKQRDALKLGRERRWFRKQDNPEQPVEQEPRSEKPSHPFFNIESSDSSSDEDTDEERQPGQPSSKKPRIPSAIKRRVDRYIQQKLSESMNPSMTMGGPPTNYPPPSFRFQYL
jgi:hypothetical protein